MAYKAEGSKIANDLRAQCGRLLEARLESKIPSSNGLIVPEGETT